MADSGSSSAYQYIFGPVPSRRLGRSLGVDLVPKKKCSLNCLFCQVGASSDTTEERLEYVPIKDVIAELETWNKTGQEADFITLSGSGEPTLHLHFGDVLTYASESTTAQTALLTNGTLLHMPDVRAQAVKADVVKASLSCWDHPSFCWVNRPGPGITFEKLVEGEVKFRSEFSGELWLEVFIVPGLNDSLENVRKIAEVAARIQPDRIQLNTAVRPPAESSVTPCPREMMEAYCDLFEPHAEIISSFSSSQNSVRAVTARELLDVLRRRPCSKSELAESLDADADSVAMGLRELFAAGLIYEELRRNRVFYCVKDNGK